MTHNTMATLTLACSVALLSMAGTIEAKTITVALDGSGDCRSVNEAVAMVPDLSQERNTIHIKAGTYVGAVVIPKEKINISFEGEGAEKTILSWDQNPTVHLQANNCRFSNLTMSNTAGDTGPIQALTADGDRTVFENCRLLGWQDTLMVNEGVKYFHNCYIEGRVDFIFGGAVAVFDSCELHSKNGGFLTAASNPPEAEFGYVFLNCKLTGEPNPWVDPKTGKTKTSPGALSYLGRPWRADAQVAYINCVMDDHIRSEGWEDWGNADNHKTVRYSEYNSRMLDGKPADTSKRVPWSKQLTAKEAARYTLSNILTDGWNDWDPTTPDGKPAESVAVICYPNDAKITGDHAHVENGGANIGYWDNTDTKIAWQSNLPAGKYRVGLSYALDSSAQGCTLQIQIGDQVVKYEAKPTGGWSNYRTLEIGTFSAKGTDAVPVTVIALEKQGNFLANVKGVVFARVN